MPGVTLSVLSGDVAVMLQSIMHNTTYRKCFAAQPHLLQLAHDVSLDGFVEPAPCSAARLPDFTASLLAGKLRIEDVAQFDQQFGISDHISNHINEDVLLSCRKYSKEVSRLTSECRAGKRAVGDGKRRRARRVPEIPDITASSHRDTSRPKSPVNSFSLADELRQVDSSFGSREQHETADVGWRRLDTPSGTDYPRDCRDVVRGAAEFCRRDEFLDDEMTPDRRVTSEKWGVTPEKWGGHCGRSSPVSPPSSRYSDQSSGSVSAGSTPGTYQEAPGSPHRSALSNIDDLEATHRGCHKFIPRHRGEMFIEIGDPIHVEIEADDLWCEGINLRTQKRGIFPAAYATDLSFLETVDVGASKPTLFYLNYLGSIEVNYHKGNSILIHAINKVALSRRLLAQCSHPPLCCLEINEYGIKMTDEIKKKTPNSSTAAGRTSVTQRLMKMLSKEKDAGCNNHFFSMKNISFCGYHPTNNRYFAFITKHPLHMRFACHVFLSDTSTVHISQVVGNAFKRFYQEYMAFVHPTEDIYLE